MSKIKQNDTDSGYKDPGLGTMIAYSAGNLPVGMLLLVVSTWAMRLYCPSADEVGRVQLVDPQVFGLASLVVMIVGGFTDLLVGYWSDHHKGKSGRRQPFMRFGLPFLVFSFLLLWFPPVNGLSDVNVTWLFVMLGVLHVSFTVVFNPYLALMPEVWRTEAGRVRVSAWMAGFNALAQIVAFVGFGLAIDALMGGGEILGFHVPDGFKVAAVLAAFLTVICMLPVLTRIKETPHTDEKNVPFNLLQAGWETLKNPAFLPYIISASMLYAAQFMITAALPFLVVTKVVDDPSKGDLVASFLLLGLVVLASLMLPVVDWATKHVKKTHLYMASLIIFTVLVPLATLAGSIPGVPPMPHLIAILIILAPALAVGFVIPRAILADVMDHDTERTGYRREAMYNGMEGLTQKIAGGLALAFQGTLFANFGYTSKEPMGIILTGAAAGLLSLIGVIAFTQYPLKK